jgi:hypothetical protein
MPPQQQPLSECKHLGALCASLDRERTTTVKQLASGSRFGELKQEDKQLVSSMLKELSEYEHYLHSLRDATFLNKFITMVQSFNQKKTREIYLDLSEVVGQAFCNTLEDFLFKLHEVSLLHERLQGYLNCQSFRSWAVGSRHNKTHKHKALFRYSFPDCDFNRPLVIRNPDLHVDNATKMFFQLVDVFTKMKDTRGYVLSKQSMLWLGRREYVCDCRIKNTSDCKERAWFTIDASTTKTASDQCSVSPLSYNAIWFPAFSMFIQFKSEQTIRDRNLFIAWKDTLNCCDTLRQQALLDRCLVGEPIVLELYTRPIVDWNLYCPFTLLVNYCKPITTQSHCTSASPQCCQLSLPPPITSGSALLEVANVQNDNVLLLHNVSCLPIGGYVSVQFKTANIKKEHWQEPLEQLLHFYKCLIENQDMQMLQTESQEKQIQNVADCIRKNVSMYRDLVGDYVQVNNVQAVNKIRKLNELISSIEDMLCVQPATVIATSHKENVKYVLQSHRRSKYNKHPHHHTNTNKVDSIPCTTSPYHRVDCDDMISDFEDDCDI